MIGTVVTIVLFYFVGKLSDMLPSKVAIPLGLLLRGLVLLAFLFLTSPTSVASYLTFSILFLSFLFEAVTLEAYFCKNVPKDIRGILYALMAVFGTFGQLLCSKVGGYLFDNAGPYWPFVFASICDFAYLLFILIMILLKYID
jgi:MFS family permease